MNLLEIPGIHAIVASLYLLGMLYATRVGERRGIDPAISGAAYIVSTMAAIAAVSSYF